jgi:DNA-binding NarL/FixJ family response regulator
MATCESADELLVLVAHNKPDVVIVDIRLPPTFTNEGMKAALTIRAHHRDVGVLVLSQYVEVGLAMQLLADTADGAGHLLKDRVSNVTDFIDAVHRVADGGSAIDPTIVSALIAKKRNRDPLWRLTPREREVLALMAEGRSNQGIAHEFAITSRAVEKYVSSIFSKLNMPSTTGDSRRVFAVLLYLRG